MNDSSPSPATVKLTLPLEETPGTLLGRYKILEKVGEGGFGVVYVAEQREPVKRRVALKIIKLGMDTRQVVGRFEAERQALAMMDHPNIAKVLDAGATEEGRPFFVMELVRGIRITDYCDQHRLSTTERLKLFIQVCHAIQHAHQKGIIHRDIKPSNILVTLHDGVPVPKVIDFGIAKATQGELTDKTVYTQFQQFIGTPAYISPEQAEMSGLDIDTRSDIYSLGVLLYELLTGRTPFDQKQLIEAGLDGMRRMIRDIEPARPSTRVNALEGEDRTTTASRRQTEVPRLIHLLRGDLDWVVMKALEKDRTRRYETANGLAMELQRYLNHEPVIARPPDKLYRLRKTIRRNKLAVGAVGIFTVALVLGATVSAWLAIRATRAEAIARRDRDDAAVARQQTEAINRFLTEDLLRQATPDQNARERKVTMEEVLNRAARNLDQDTGVARQPLIEATLRLAFGSTYYKLGVLSEAERHLRRAVVLRQSALGPEHLESLKAQAALAEYLVLGARKFAEGEALGRQTWLARQRLLGSEHRDTIDAMSTYVAAVAIPGDKAEQAEPLARQVLELRQRVNGPNDYATIDALGNLAYVLATLGKFTDAERFGREELARFQQAGFADKINALYSANNLALYRLLQGDTAEAEKLFIEAIPRAERTHGPEHLITLHLQHNLARIYAVQGRLGQAEKLARETLAKRRRVTPELEAIGRTMLILGRVLLEKREFDEADALLHEALGFYRERYAMKTGIIAQIENSLGAIQLARHAYPEAETLLLHNASELFKPTTELGPREMQVAIGNIVQLYQAWAKPDQAAEWQKKLDELAKPQVTLKTP